MLVMSPSPVEGIVRWLCHVVDEIRMNLANGDQRPRVLSIHRAELFQEGGAIVFNDVHVSCLVIPRLSEFPP